MKNYEMITIEEISEILRVSERTVYDWAQKGEIPGGKFGNVWRFKRSEIEQWIDRKLRETRDSAALTDSLESCMTKENVVFLECDTKKEAISEMCNILAQSAHVLDKEELKREMFRREELMSTGIGLSIAIPHVRLNSVNDFVMAFGVCRHPLTDYETLDNKPVEFICMIAAHFNQHARYLKILASISKRLKSEEIRSKIKKCKDTASVYRILTGGDL